MSNSESFNTEAIIRQLVLRIRAKKRFEILFIAFLMSLSFGLALNFIVTYFFSGYWILIFLAAICVFVTSYIYHVRKPSYAKVSKIRLLEHLNRQIPAFQESAHLLCRNKKSLNFVQKMQLQRVQDIFERYWKDGSIASVLPKINLQHLFTVFLAGFLIVSASYTFTIIAPRLVPTNNSVSGERESNTEASKDNALIPEIFVKNIFVQPPAYTQESLFSQTELNLKIIQGSEVVWQFSFSRPDLDYFLITSDKKHFALTSGSSGSYEVTRKINQTLLYRVAYRENGVIHNFPGVYSVAVVLDRSPKIKILKPNRSLLEISKTAIAEFKIETLVTDDYGIETVEIVASVAKGSGEAVKFRDEKFNFDDFQIVKDGRVYQRQWQLSELGMEPGDEVYFSVVASDNRSPESQSSKSSTVIVRWLDDEEIKMGAEGIQISFIPEYFRSQRQIIIETEQLLEDKKDLNDVDFTTKSVDLGHSQRDLKEKYGQYLGDEFGESEGAQLSLRDGYHGGEDILAGEASAGLHSDDQHDDQQDNKESEEARDQHEESIGHAHDELVDSQDLSGAKKLIAQFTHNHGAVEIAPLSKRDPKSWMKQAVSVMWKAELHLMLSEPEKALSFEYEAYQYLKLARQAERIYVKRLGFEPPPVKESNRLTGELDAILNHSLSIEDSYNEETDHYLFAQGHQLINAELPIKSLDSNAKILLSKLKKRFLELAESRPVLISYAATLERALVEESLVLSDCEDCVTRLANKLWQLLSKPDSMPAAQNNWHIDNQILKKYQRGIQALKRDQS